MKVIECRKTFLVDTDAVTAGRPVLAIIANLHGHPANGGKRISLPKVHMNFFQKDGKGTSVYGEIKKAIENSKNCQKITYYLNRANYEVLCGNLTRANASKLMKLANQKMSKIINN